MKTVADLVLTFVTCENPGRTLRIEQVERFFKSDGSTAVLSKGRGQDGLLYVQIRQPGGSVDWYRLQAAG